ncbi:MAG: dihydrolipoamide acetyltransferase family protein, partial [Chloroflexota bacterium]
PLRPPPPLRPTTANAAPAQPATPPPAPAARSGAFAAPSVRLFAREIGVDIATVTGSAPGGRIDIEDVKRHAREHTSSAASTSSYAPQALPDFSAFGPVAREPLSRFRRTVARNMVTSASEIPQVTLFASADIGAFEAVRRAHRDEASKAGSTITNLVILVKLIALALREFPHFNASIDMQADELVLKDYVHIGLAVDTDRGLAVSVFRDADKKSLAELAVDLKGIIERSKANTMTIEEMRGSTFTISTLESMGIGHFTPLVNWPEVAILGVGRDTDLPSYENDELHARRRWALSLSLDHRVVDGADGARFLSWLVNAIQQPSMLDAGGAS